MDTTFILKLQKNRIESNLKKEITVEIIKFIKFFNSHSKLLKLKFKDDNFISLVSLIVAAYNEEKSIEKKMKNCIELDYPGEKLEIVKNIIIIQNESGKNSGKKYWPN